MQELDQRIGSARQEKETSYMPAEAANETTLPRKRKSSDTSSLSERLGRRLSKELVIALCGPLGCGIKHIHRTLSEQLQLAGYVVVDIRVSELLVDHANKTNNPLLKDSIPDESDKSETRISKLQTLGNHLRKHFGNSIGAELSIQNISVWRDNHPSHKDPDKIAVSQPTAFIIDQLKHPAEAELLKQLYGPIFYQIGVLSNNDDKIQRLKNNKIEISAAIALIEKDRKEDIKHGQQLEKTLLFSDYFINHSSGNLPSIKANIERFLSLAHGVNGITPTRDEIGMYSAYSSSLRSACLSRQVGAAIADKDGNIIATGRNDVPRSGGGLYEAEDRENDHRCINHGAKCHNQENINSLKEDIQEILKQSITDERSINKIIEDIASKTRLGSLIEFSRAIHAEMDAIISLARSSTSGIVGSTIYTTTYPCHNCARHIVSAGIQKVVFIEPYEKSMAIELHSDAIERDSSGKNKVSITCFEGTAPRRYQRFFMASGKRKDENGAAVSIGIRDLNHIDSILVAKYTESEDQVVNHINDRLSDVNSLIMTANIDTVTEPDSR